MKVLKKGKQVNVNDKFEPLHTKYVKECLDCGCVFEADEDDIDFDGKNQDYAICPNCGKMIVVNTQYPSNVKDFNIDIITMEKINYKFKTPDKKVESSFAFNVTYSDSKNGKVFVRELCRGAGGNLYEQLLEELYKEDGNDIGIQKKDI